MDCCIRPRVSAYNTSSTIWNYGEDWDHDNTPYNPIAFCSGYDSAYSTENPCIANNGTWIEEQGTENIAQTGEPEEPTIDDVADGCTGDGVSESGNYDDCDNSAENNSETIWDYGSDWNHDGIDYIEPECLIDNESDCTNLGLIWTSVLHKCRVKASNIINPASILTFFKFFHTKIITWINFDISSDHIIVCFIIA